MFGFCQRLWSIVQEFLTTLFHSLSAHLRFPWPTAPCFSPAFLSSRLTKPGKKQAIVQKLQYQLCSAGIENFFHLYVDIKKSERQQ